MNLSELKNGSSAIIVGVGGDSTTIKRLVEMGFIKGREIKAIKNAPLKDPIEYELMGYNISLRREEASLVEIIYAEQLIAGCGKYCSNTCCNSRTSEKKFIYNTQNRTINVAIVGNPNCGKTTLYNSLSGSSEHTGNYAGVTVEFKTTSIKHKGYKINITDLPGIYSLSNNLAEEEVVCDVLWNKNFDFIINVVDATLLERNLFLTTQLMDMGQHVVVALNMYDELLELGDTFDYKSLSKMIGIPFIPTVANKGEGAIKILDSIVKRFSKEESHIHIESNMGEIIEDALQSIASHLGDTFDKGIPKRYAAMMLLDHNKQYEVRADHETLNYCKKVRHELEKEYSDSITQILANARYGYISGALRETHTMKSVNRHTKTTSIDNILTHKFWGLPIFIGIMWLMFYSVFTLGAPLQDLIDMGVSWISSTAETILPNGAIKDLICNGIIDGVGSVIIFLPNILILFLFIAILEDSGYMARAAFIMDRLMHKIGLHGKSFIPLIMGFGCNVPAIMATRIIEDPKNRLLTMLILPFMSCSARLPVYILFIGAFFPEYGALMLLGLYLLGILLAVFSSLLLKKILFKSKDQPFVMELPPYRVPTSVSVLKHMWSKAGQYLKKMGTVILIGSAIIWALSYYPTKEESYLKDIGHAIEPAIEPLGFDWKIGVSLVSGIAAKEIVIGTMGVLHNVDGEDEDGLVKQLQNDTRADGSKVYSVATVLSLLAFILIYFPCIGVVAALKRESGSWKWAVFSMVYTTGLAWVVSFAIYNLAS